MSNVSVTKTDLRKKGMALADFNGAPLMLPPTPFFYTLDQVLTMLALESRVLREYLYLDGRTVLPKGRSKADYILTINLAHEDSAPVWRIEEAELTRWLRRKGMVTAKSRLVVRGAKNASRGG